MSTPRIRLPGSASPGEVVEVRTLIDHPMVTGISSPAPRDMLARFDVTSEGETLFAYEFDNGSAANPSFTFHLRVEGTTALAFTWAHEDGTTFTAEHVVEVV